MSLMFDDEPVFQRKISPGMDGYEELDIIGRGSFGIIRKVKRKSDGKILARKDIDYRGMSTIQKKQLVAEVNILRELNHPNIVRYFDRYVDKENCMIYIIMEYCSHGDLAALIKRCRREGKVFSEEMIWNVFAQVLLALDECHHGNIAKKGSILHRDIKPENVFLDGDQMAKLGDFGLSRVLDRPEVDLARTFVGTPYYMSPEIVNESKYDAKSDIWALGCLIYEMCALNPPFQAETQANLYSKISSGYVERVPSRYSEELNRMIQAMLHQDKEKRPSTRDFLRYDKIRIIIANIDLKRREAFIKEKEDYLRRREEDLKMIESRLKERENDVSLAELKIKKRYIELEDVERSLRSSIKSDNLSTPRANRSLRDQENSENLLDMMIISPAVNTLKAMELSSAPSTPSVNRRKSMTLDHSPHSHKALPPLLPQQVRSLRRHSSLSGSGSSTLNTPLKEVCDKINSIKF